MIVLQNNGRGSHHTVSLILKLQHTKDKLVENKKGPV
jgi:hypothetical protein